MVESGVKYHKHNPRPTVIQLQENFKIALILLDYIFHYSCLSYEEIKQYIFTRMKQHYYCLL